MATVKSEKIDTDHNPYGETALFKGFFPNGFIVVNPIPSTFYTDKNEKYNFHCSVKNDRGEIEYAYYVKVGEPIFLELIF